MFRIARVELYLPPALSIPKEITMYTTDQATDLRMFIFAHFTSLRYIFYFVIIYVVRVCVSMLL